MITESHHWGECIYPGMHPFCIRQSVLTNVFVKLWMEPVMAIVSVVNGKAGLLIGDCEVVI